jgi:Na+-translocating ferredoxin:NAD+ oxidoreductase RnfC subunit
MMKYQMIFVKIEVYLMNFYHIYNNYNFPLLKLAFNNIKAAALVTKSQHAAKSLLILGKLKRAFFNLQHIEKRKKQHGLMKAFQRIKDGTNLTSFLQEIKSAKQSKIRKMKELLIERKSEVEQLTQQLDGGKGKIG